MEAFGLSTLVVALAEMGDKTQLLAIALAAQFAMGARAVRMRWAIVAGIFVATLANHLLAAGLGAWLSDWAQSAMGQQWLRWVVGLGFLGFAAWVLVPDAAPGLAQAAAPHSAARVFGLTSVAFFVAEMGDKTQFATVALAARFNDDWLWVSAGTTLGMLLANAPAVWLGAWLAQRLRFQTLHRIAAAVFAALGLWTLLGP
jgi:Ca2+/H+ antiporter, TMEM165/GDT1 family